MLLRAYRAVYPIHTHIPGIATAAPPDFARFQHVRMRTFRTY
jgi:hypothetical protein